MEAEYILVSDRKTDASFLIYHYLSFYLREGCKVCFLGLVQSFSHYSAVSQRLGVNLDQARESGQLLFLEGLKESVGVFLDKESNPRSSTFDFLRDPSVGLRGLYEFIRGSLVKPVPGADPQAWGPPVLLVDDLSVLLSLGLDVGAVIDFSHYCRATVCSELQGSMVVLVRCEAEEESLDKESSEMLLKGLTHQCSLTLLAQGLPTGFCKDIHGQVEVCWQGHGEGKQTQRKVFQYKVHDKGASFFAPGTSSAAL
ncbi:elongator complex protein 6 [Aplochiton taeniatus]